MTSTPLFLNSGDTPCVSLTPKPSKTRPGPLPSPTRGLSESLDFQLNLTRIIGTTTSSSCAFDCLPDLSCFAVCAGSAAIVNYVDPNSKITQKLFRVKGSAGYQTNGSSDSLVGTSTPEAKNRQRLLKSSIFNAKAVGSPSNDYGASPGKIAARQRTRSAACISLSRDGKLLALGETGYSPRILIFSISGASDFPIATISEHSFGVRCLAFSPSGKWLCSVGAVHDGFIYLWAINPRTLTAKLHASNKCTSTVHSMCWMGNAAVVTIGTRHVRVWRIETAAPASPTKSKFRSDSQDASSTPGAASKTLAGRNCLLGSMLESTFHAVVAISESKAVLGSDKGDICLLDDADGLQKFARVSGTDFAITSMTIDPSTQRLWLAGQDETIQSISSSQLALYDTQRVSPSRSYSVDSSMAQMSLSETRSRSCTALGYISDPQRLVTVDASHRVSILSIEGHLEAAGFDDMIETAPAHLSSVLGTGIVEDDQGQVLGFVTWASTGSVLFLSRTGEYEHTKTVPLGSLPFIEDEETNELRAFRAAKLGKFFVSGDRNGSICILDKDNWLDATPMAAHQGEVNDIAVVESSAWTLVATCSRDRTIQLFKREASSLTLIQTIDQHGSSVNHLLFHDVGNTMISASSDRTIIIYTLATTDSAIAFIATRIITLKTSPVSMTLIPGDGSCSILVSNMDRQLHLYDLASGVQLQNVKLFDNDNNESIMLTSIAALNLERQGIARKVVVGVSSMDKSIRVHDIESGSTLAKDYGHSEGVTGLVVVQHEEESYDLGHLLITTGLDGTIMQWDLKHVSQNMSEGGIMGSPVFESPIAATPLRRVLSRTALAEFQSSLDSRGVTPSTSRSHSPSRLRRQVSRYSLATSSSASKANAPFKRSNRSPSPPSPGTPTMARRPGLDRNRTKSVGNFNDINTTAEQLCKSLRAFRKKMTTNLESLRADNAAEVERELNLTMKLISSTMNPPKLVASEQVAMDLMGRYSQKLAQMVEEKVAIEVVKQSSKASSDTPSTTFLDDTPTEAVGKG